jgi:hypothetical protein
MSVAVTTLSLGFAVSFGAVTYYQQEAIEALASVAVSDMDLDAAQEAKLWDLHRRVVKLENEDQRIMAHVKWFVQRRSGTAELRKMERAIENLENVD